MIMIYWFVLYKNMKVSDVTVNRKSSKLRQCRIKAVLFTEWCSFLNSRKVPYRTVFCTFFSTLRQTHSGEILMGAAPGNRAGKPPEITLPVAAKPCNFYPAKIMEKKLCLSWLMKKGPAYSSAKKCDKNATTRKYMRSCYRAKRRKNTVKSCVLKRFGAQKSIKVGSFNQRARDLSSLRQSGPGWWL